MDQQEQKLIRQKKLWIGVAIAELLVIGYFSIQFFSQPLGFDATRGVKCYKDDDTPPKNFLKIEVEIKPKKEARFRLFDLNNADYTGCIETDSEDHSMTFTTYVDTTGKSKIYFDGKIRSLDAIKNKVKFLLTLSTQQGVIIDKIERDTTIIGTVKSILLTDSLLIYPVKP